MYVKRIISKAFDETRKFWTLHRNWTVVASPLAAVGFRVIRSGWNTARTDLLGTILAAGLGYMIAWVGTLLINMFRAPVLLDRDREAQAVADKLELAALRTSLEREQYNLSGSPQFILGFNQEFFIRNTGQIDGRDAKVHSMRVNDFLLFSDQVSYVGIGDTAFNLKCRKDDDSEGSPVLNRFRTSMQAFQMFIEEIIRTTPLPEAIQNEEDAARRATREYQYLMMNNHMLVLDLMYSDFAGHQYLSPAIVAWTMKDGGRIVEVRPQPIRKLTMEQAQQLNSGEYLRTVAGVDRIPDTQDGTGGSYQLSSERRLLP